jgi:uncharacterized protein (TIGR02302 family)
MRSPVPVPLQRAFAVLTWERAVPAFLPFLIGLGFVAAILWSGAFAFLPLWGHLLALGLAFLGPLALLLRGARRFRFPKRREALRRIEERSGLKPGVLDMAWAKSFDGAEDNPLWQSARARLAQTIGQPKAPLPRLSLRKVDPWRLRYGAVLALLVAVGLTGGKSDGLKMSFAPPLPPPPVVLVDAWIEPPAYTGRAAIVLPQNAIASRYVVPEDSRLHVRMRREDGRKLRSIITFEPQDGRRRRVPTTRQEGISATLDLDESGVVHILAGRADRRIDLRLRRDQAPRVAIRDEVDTATGTIRLTAVTEDEYPLTEGELLLTLLPGQKMSRDAPAPSEASLENPEVIEVAQLTGPPGEVALEIPSEEHPWAGLLVKGQLRVLDGRGQEGLSEPFAFTMPQRTFYNPLSRAVIEERQKLALDPGPQLGKAADLFAALVEAPDLFDVEPADHLMLKATAEAVRAARQRDVADLIEGLWPLAIELEDDGLAFAKAQLDAAEQALREALQNGASDNEIRERIANLREAMNAYIAALAESGYGRAEPGSQGEAFGENDLDELLRQMEELANQGLRGEAEDLLAQLEALLQSLQLAEGSGQPGGGEEGESGAGSSGGQGQGQSPGQNALSGTGDLMQRQRELSDDTFSARRGERGSGGLGQAQSELADALGALRGDVPDDAGDAMAAIDKAEQAMRDAARALERGDLGIAQSYQEDAINALRQAGSEIAEAVEGEEDGEGETAQGYDPLGRALSGRSGDSPEDFGLYDPERIRELIARIRSRLEEPGLSEDERTYLESLLERF